jgi:exodeoxyribonuclease V alpha subunit
MVRATAKLAFGNKLPVTDKQIESAIWEMELSEGFELEKMQKQAVFCAIKNRVSVITGGPGTGKSTITKAIVKAWMKQYAPHTDPNAHVVMCAPTGRAARRAAELSGVNGETIQRILARHAYEDALDTKLFILDEASMLDIRLASQLINLVKDKHFLVLIGDVDQLPPIGPGHFFRDCVQSAFIPTVQLTLSHRQKGKIAVNANRVNMGEGFHALNIDDPSFQFVYARKDTAQQEVVRQYLALLEKGYSVQDVCCVVPMRKKGKSCTAADELNPIIRDAVNPPPADLPNDFRDEDLRPGDRVMNTENDYNRQVFNGDCGIVDSVDSTTGAITVLMDDGRYVDFSKNCASFLILAYVTTVHKAQGSEYKAVVVVQNVEHMHMLQRNLLYTALTRAKDELVLIGEPRAIDMAVGKIPALERNTCLKERIKTLVVKAL